MSAASKLERVLFSHSRDREYFDANELRTMTGQPIERFPDVVVKELGDNGLDAAEQAGVAPTITIQVWRREKDVVIRIVDKAGGIPPETVKKILDFKTRTSDKAAFRSPTRGLQGNALKTVIGIPYALGSRKPVLIDAKGKKFLIRPHIDPAGVVHLDFPCRDTEDRGGTTWTVSLPLSACEETNFARWARVFALFNPHAIVKYREFCAPSELDKNANPQARKRTKIYNPAVPFPGGNWHKFLPTDLIPIHWYDLASLQRLVFSFIARSREGGENLTLRQFIGQFPHFSGNQRTKHVCDQFPDIDRLSDFEGREGRVGALLHAMQSAPGIKRPKPESLGCVGKKNFQKRFEDWYGIKRTGDGKARYWYEKACLEVAGVPYVFEVAVAQTKRRGGFFHGVNFSPTFDDPLEATYLRHDYKSGRGRTVDGHGARGFLEHAYVLDPEYTPEKLPFHSAVAVHLVCPALPFRDKGKTRLSLPSGMSAAIAEAIYQAAKVLHPEGVRRKKDAARQEKADRERERQPDDKRMKLTKSVPLVMPEALDHATGEMPRVSRHTLYYSVRPRVQQYSSRPLTSQYFEQDLLTRYIRQHPETAKRVYSEPRGVLYEPHTGKEVPLGTLEVEKYILPAWRYDKILFVEKQGLWPVLKDALLAERFDMAIIAGEGYATEACRMLFQFAHKGKYQLFVIHDADPWGMNIARTLREETKRMPGYKVDVNDIGLRLADALARGLAVEEFTRDKALPQALELTDLEREYFVGRQVGKNSWICKRVELNAFTAPGFVDYIVEGLEAHGATGKVIPLKGKLPDLAKGIFHDEAKSAIREELDDLLSVDAIWKTVARELIKEMPLKEAPQWIEEGFMEDETLSWDASLKQSIGQQIKDKKERLRELLLAKLQKVIESNPELS